MVHVHRLRPSLRRPAVPDSTECPVFLVGYLERPGGGILACTVLDYEFACAYRGDGFLNICPYYFREFRKGQQPTGRKPKSAWVSSSRF